MISVDGVQLDDNLYIEGEYSQPARLMSVRQTIGGRTVIQETIAGVDNLLVVASRMEGEGYLGHWTKTQLDGIRVLEASGKVVQLVVENRSWWVKVLAGGISVDPLRPRPNAAGSDRSIGSVTFIKI